MKSFEIESDCLDIVKRLKDIDKDYFVKFNLETGKFEVHSHAQKHTYCFTAFDRLDERTLTLALKTRVQNFDKLIEEMDRENEIRRKKVVKEILNDFEEKLYES